MVKGGVRAGRAISFIDVIVDDDNYPLRFCLVKLGSSMGDNYYLEKTVCAGIIRPRPVGEILKGQS